MKLQVRILTYSILFFTYSFSTSFLLTLGEKLKDHRFITLGCGFLLINLIFSFLVFKWAPSLNIVCSAIIAFLALYLALQIGDLHFFRKFDAQGIKTGLMAYAILSVLFWEIAYQIKLKRQSKNM
ncbi:hypothetical protein QWY99_04140 [Flavobacterium branchiarum]|uniref:Permease n=1 Tax=Flavobacterium branchiarum TaxID=1114870 RepID=A0ABV5FKK5_9FLAO|nr:hypothetical protein [Flavobacterium branchiarum]MDN3672249.1 hypothetical protein [Flavobacterium branchiarum]